MRTRRWTNILVGVVGGGFGVKILDYSYKEIRSKLDKKINAKTIVDKHLDPILKSADELVGKMRSLAELDFKELTVSFKPQTGDFDAWIPYLNIVYLFAQFWARIQILRIESVFVNFASNDKGIKLQKFINALESSRSRIVDRSWQRGMGEAILKFDGKEIRVYTFKEFVDEFLSSEKNKKWFNPLIEIITNIKLKKNRQTILFYGSILHSLVDTLDPKHLVTKYRPSWPNKLSKKNVRDLKYRVFREYLPFVKEPYVYYSKKNRSRNIDPRKDTRTLSGFYQVSL